MSHCATVNLAQLPSVDQGQRGNIFLIKRHRQVDVEELYQQVTLDGTFEALS